MRTAPARDGHGQYPASEIESINEESGFKTDETYHFQGPHADLVGLVGQQRLVVLVGLVVLEDRPDLKWERNTVRQEQGAKGLSTILPSDPGPGTSGPGGPLFPGWPCGPGGPLGPKARIRLNGSHKALGSRLPGVPLPVFPFSPLGPLVPGLPSCPGGPTAPIRKFLLVTCLQSLLARILPGGPAGPRKGTRIT